MFQGDSGGALVVQNGGMTVCIYTSIYYIYPYKNYITFANKHFW